MSAPTTISSLSKYGQLCVGLLKAYRRCERERDLAAHYNAKDNAPTLEGYHWCSILGIKMDKMVEMYVKSISYEGKTVPIVSTRDGHLTNEPLPVSEGGTDSKDGQAFRNRLLRVEKEIADLRIPNAARSHEDVNANLTGR